MTALLDVYPRLPVELISAKGAILHTKDGRELLDLYGAHAVCPLGHAHPDLTDALVRQYQTLDFYSNSVHMAVQERAARAVLHHSAHLGHVHFVNSGAEANESAMHLARRLTGRSKVVTLSTSFHGRTLGALAATGLAGYQTRLSLPFPRPWHDTLQLGQDNLDLIDQDVACVLIESVVSLGGVHLAPTGWLERVAARAHDVGALYVLDEVQGGVGRLGEWWGHDALGTSKPDMVTLAKSLGGGFPVAALVTSHDIGAKVTYGELGTTFGGGPLAAAMVEATAKIIQQPAMLARVKAIEAGIRAQCQQIPNVSVRGLGCLLGIQTPRLAKDVRDALLAKGFIVGTSGDAHTLRLLPPYILVDDEISRFGAALAEVLDA